MRANLNALVGSVRNTADIAGVGSVLVAGGGADLFQGALQDVLPHAEVVAVRACVTANARGFYEFTKIAGMA